MYTKKGIVLVQNRKNYKILPTEVPSAHGGTSVPPVEAVLGPPRSKSITDFPCSDRRSAMTNPAVPAPTII